MDLLPSAGPNGREKARRALEALDWEEASDAVFSELAASHQDLSDCVERIDIKRWGHAMVGPLPGTYTSVSRQAAQKPQGRIHFAHTDLSGVALFEEAFAQESVRPRRSSGESGGPLAGLSEVRSLGLSFSGAALFGPRSLGSGLGPRRRGATSFLDHRGGVGGCGPRLVNALSYLF